MIKTIFYILFLLICGSIFFPFLDSLLNYVSFGLDRIIFAIDYIIDILFVFLNSFVSYNYIMLMLTIFVSLKVIFYIIDTLRGE